MYRGASDQVIATSRQAAFSRLSNGDPKRIETSQPSVPDRDVATSDRSGVNASQRLNCLASQYLCGPDTSTIQPFISLPVLAAVATVVSERFPSLDANRFTPKSLD